MKVLYILLISLSITLYKAEKCNGSKPSQPSDCYNREKSDEEEYKCCYIYKKYYSKGQLEKIQSCASLTKIEFDNIKDIMKSFRAGIEKIGGIIEAYEIDCSSNYLYISLISIMIFLL